MTDLGPATTRMAALVEGVADHQLDAATPCPTMSLGDLVDHVGTFAVVFGAIARKDRPVAPEPPDGANLEPGWRRRIVAHLDALATAWRDPSAVQGTASAGGLELPTATLRLVALDELVVHGWDLAAASGQPYDPDPADVADTIDFVTAFEAPRDGSLFGPVVAVPEGAPGLHRLLGLTGRDPAWAPPTSP